MEDGAAEKTLSELVAQPKQVARVIHPRRCGCLDLEREHASAPVFHDHVDLVPPLLLPEVEEAGGPSNSRGR
jgi:hypothetical protein